MTNQRSRTARRYLIGIPLAIVLGVALAFLGTAALAGRSLASEDWRMLAWYSWVTDEKQLAGDATLLFYMTEEAQEGRDAWREKRNPDFTKFPRRP